MLRILVALNDVLRLICLPLYSNSFYMFCSLAGTTRLCL